MGMWTRIYKFAISCVEDRMFRIVRWWKARRALFLRITRVGWSLWRPDEVQQGRCEICNRSYLHVVDENGRLLGPICDCVIRQDEKRPDLPLGMSQLMERLRRRERECRPRQRIRPYR
jgi:hypothetical protein